MDELWVFKGIDGWSVCRMEVSVAFSPEMLCTESDAMRIESAKPLEMGIKRMMF